MKKIETGRSMVEMLGVLAIIGVLSVMGIYSYTIAIRKYRANEIVQTASALAVMSSSMNQGDGGCVKLSTSDLPKKPGGVDLEMVAETLNGNTTVSIQIDEDDNSLYDIVESTVGNASYDVDSDPTRNCE